MTSAPLAAVDDELLRKQVVQQVSSLGLAWQPAFGLITLLYFYSHYFFASGQDGSLDGSP